MNSESQDNSLPDVDILDWVLFGFFLVAFIGTLILFDVLQRIALLFGAHQHERTVSLMCKCLVLSLKILGVTLRVQKNETITAKKPLIIISNHQSLFDVPLLYTVFDPFVPKFIAKKELTHWIPGISINLRRGGNAIIDRNNARQAIPEIKKLGQRIDLEGFSAVIFPEGTRARDGKLKDFHSIGIATLLKVSPKADVVPVALDGSWRLAARKYGPIPRATKITIIVGPKIERSATQKAQDIANECHAWIANTLEKNRSSEVHLAQA